MPEVKQKGRYVPGKVKLSVMHVNGQQIMFQPYPIQIDVLKVLSEARGSVSAEDLSESAQIDRGWMSEMIGNLRTREDRAKAEAKNECPCLQDIRAVEIVSLEFGQAYRITQIGRDLLTAIETATH